MSSLKNPWLVFYSYEMASNIKTVNVTELERQIKSGATDDIVVVTPFKHRNSREIVTFKTPEEFKAYYAIHKMHIDSTTTNGLNKLYKVEGHKLGRRKDVIMVIPATKSSAQPDRVDLLSDAVNDMAERLEEINLLISELPKIKKGLKQCMDTLNSIRRRNPPEESLEE